MKKNFERTLAFIMRAEGNKVVNDPDDPGGLTSSYGLTLATMQRLKLDLNKDGKVDGKDVNLVTADVVKSVFKKNYWDAIKADELNPGFDLILADLAYNAGPGRAREYSDYDDLRKLTDARIAFYENLCRASPVLNKFIKGWKNRAEKAYQEALKCGE
jgi:lysozyme family protein